MLINKSGTYSLTNDFIRNFCGEDLVDEVSELNVEARITKEYGDSCLHYNVSFSESIPSLGSYVRECGVAASDFFKWFVEKH